MQLSVMKFDDFPRNTQSDAVTVLFRTEEWDKYLVTYRIGYTASIVCNGDVRMSFVITAGKKMDFRILLFFYGISRIGNKINYHLF